MGMLMENRRRLPRARRTLPVHVIDADGDFSVTSGTTVDIGAGGLRVSMEAALPAASDALVQVVLPGGGQVISTARVAECESTVDGHVYRLVFLDLSDDDQATLLWLALTTGW